MIVSTKNNCFFIVPDAGPVESIDIFGFSTEELFEALTTKARNDTQKWCVDGEIPDLLEQLHVEMANGVTQVRIYNSN